MTELNTRMTLLAKIKNQHDEASWADFVTYYKAYLFKVIHTMGVNNPECEDLVQRVLLKVWEEIPSFDYQRERGKFRSWLTRIAWNFVRKYFRTSRRMTKALEDGQFPKLEPYLKETMPADIENLFQQEWEAYIAQMAWKNVSPTLNETVRSVFQLVIEEVDDQNIAEQLNVPLPTLRVYKSRVKIKLCREIKRLENELC
ncbi:MAG: sigma-70 family RNA polymerase sigma factor [Lentisphaeraceae bacterium]|nr:sigma-70 family RNA polymerase sigma factor [Lentisphaeraceae bacterium]